MSLLSVYIGLLVACFFAGCYAGCKWGCPFGFVARYRERR